MESASLTYEQRLLAVQQLGRDYMMFNGRPLSTSMILGVCTLPQYQHQGLMHALMKIALDETEHTELVTVLQAYDPAVYQPFGFETIYRRSELVVRSEDFKRITNFGCAYEPSPVDMLKVYSAFIRRFNGFYARDLKYFEDYKKEITAEGGKIIAYYDGKNIIRGYEAILPDGLELNVEEIVYLDGMVKAARGKGGNPDFLTAGRPSTFSVFFNR